MPKDSSFWNFLDRLTAGGSDPYAQISAEGLTPEERRQANLEAGGQLLSVPGKVKEGYQEIDKSLGLPVSTPEEEAAQRRQFADSPYTGDTQASIADFIEKPSVTNFFGMPMAALGITGKPAQQVAKGAGAGEAGQALASIAGDPLMYVGVSPKALTTLSKVKEMSLTPEILKLFEAAKAGSVEARAAIAAKPELQAMQAASEAQKVAKPSSLRNRFGGVTPSAPVAEPTGSPLQRRFGGKATQPAEPKSVPVPEGAPDPRQFEQPVWSKDGTPELTRRGEFITAPEGKPMPSLAPEPQPPASPVITAPQASPAPSPVATPSVAEETAGLEATPSFWDRNKGKAKAGAIGAGAVGLASAGYSMGQTKGKQDMANAVTPPVTPSEPPPEPPPAAKVPPQAPQSPSEQDVYDQETDAVQAVALDNLQNSANDIPTAREQPESPQVQADRQRILDAQKAVDEAGQMKTPENSGLENLGLVLAALGGGLSGKPELPMRLSERLRQGQRDKVSDLQRGAASRLSGAQSGLEATLAQVRERAIRGSERVGDVKAVAELRNAANELGMKIQAERDPRKRQMLQTRMKLLESEIEKNQGAAKYYSSGSKENLDRAKAEGMQIENERQRVLAELIKQKTNKSPNRPSASK